MKLREGREWGKGVITKSFCYFSTTDSTVDLSSTVRPLIFQMTPLPRYGMEMEVGLVNKGMQLGNYSYKALIPALNAYWFFATGFPRCIRMTDPLVSSSAPPNTDWNWSFRYKTNTIKMKCTFPGFLWASHLTLPLCEMGSHVMLLTVPARTFNADSLHIWTTAKMMIHQQRWWNICQVFKIQQYINVLPGDVNANIGYYL